MNIVYSVLHYNAFEMTCECIDTLLKIIGNHSSIVVVDNNSKNNSGKQIEQKYRSNNKVHVIISKENLGFAKGNNLGYIYAKKELKADIIISMNNDVLIKQISFEKELRLLFDRKPEIAVVAPNVINKKGFNQNPFRVEREKTAHIIKSLMLHAIYYACIKTGFFRNVIYRKYHKNEDYSRSRVAPDYECEMVVPHGSCVIYMAKYIDKSDYAFIPITFFYAEEDILYDYIILNNLKTLYTNKLEVLHMEKVSTNTVSSGMWEKEAFQIKNKISSKKSHLKYRLSNHLL